MAREGGRTRVIERWDHDLCDREVSEVLEDSAHQARDGSLDDLNRGAAIEGRVANGDQFGILCSGGIPDDGGVDAADLHGIGCIGDRGLDDGGVFFDSEPVARGREEAAGFFTDGRSIRVSEGIPHLASG